MSATPDPRDGDSDRDTGAEAAAAARGLLEQHAEAVRLSVSGCAPSGTASGAPRLPCTGCTVRDLVDHVTGEQPWIPPVVTEGRTIEEIGDAFSADVLGGDPVGAWERASGAAHAAFAVPGALDRTVRLSYGPVLGRAYRAGLTADCVVHARDLSRGIEADDRLPDGLVEFALEEVMPYADGLAAGGLFAAPPEVPAGANAQTRLLALMGGRG
ncbi:TIGR03086 family metal-binding protein [Streptomyces roseus]|uniref:TIGR03086 family metal-binding protein n=1 Tax=Streptomyces roseus TaxID=66430 RepID=UPI00368951E8